MIIFRLFTALCISLVFVAGAHYQMGHTVEALATVAVAAGWLGIVYGRLTRTP